MICHSFFKSACSRDEQKCDGPLSSCTQDEKSASEDYVDRHQNEIFSLISIFIGDSSKVEEYAQQVFVDSHGFAAKHGGNLPTRLWLYRTAVRLGIASVHASKYMLAGSPKRKALDVWLMLSERDRLLLLLRDSQGLYLQVLGDLFQMDESALRDDLFSARKRAAAASRKANR